MNGRNKKQLWRTAFYLIVVFYIVIVIGLAVLIFNIPMLYQRSEQQYIDDTKERINMILQTGDDVAGELRQLKGSADFDIVVKDGEMVVFSTVVETDFSELKIIADNNLLNYYSVYEVNNGTDDYQIWLAIYKMAPQYFFELTMSVIVFGVTILSLIMTVLIIIMFRKLIMPIRRLQTNILNLKDYRLAEVSSKSNQVEYDNLSAELSEFSDDLQEKMQLVNDNYSSLERSLQKQEEKNIYQKRMASAIVHDLKTPINVAMIQAERLNKYLADNPEAQKILTDLENLEIRLMGQVNDVLQIMNEETGFNDHVQRIDVVKVAKGILELFTTMFEERQLSVAIDAPEHLFGNFRPIELKQILHNIISNACQYADTGGEFILSFDEIDHQLVIAAYNDKQNTSLIDFNHVFDLFYHMSDDDIHFGSGIGMYTIKSMVQQYNGSCQFMPVENGVLLKIILPLNWGQEDE
ncbi:sensor histidine kinase [Culicoidibacter larvae]|uniref:histidine kinase n=1 Tax=Culicoidibacter larvae TaxID=2579976 RepID=A0A5R8QHN3_9FIRM|nr:HAMP domain-containing sensor histidine kinase [Culicoidibacter larvae]TLG77472.1 HAMP domain-containing histidine kinase [Culicoidibacter larvae]